MKTGASLLAAFLLGLAYASSPDWAKATGEAKTAILLALAPRELKDAGLAKALADAAARGVAVRLIADALGAKDPKAYTAFLSLRGVEVRLARVAESEGVFDGVYLGPPQKAASFRSRFASVWQRAPAYSIHAELARKYGYKPLEQNPFEQLEALVKSAIANDIWRQAQLERVLRAIGKKP
ncbi:MAG: hypothetical protein QXD60_03190 [Nanopusillaceae archaeon]